MTSNDEKAHAFEQAISEAFEPYLSLWVESQDKYVVYPFLPNQTSANIHPDTSRLSYPDIDPNPYVLRKKTSVPPL